jgi:sulfur carrier protein ThiS adenylyltransferase
MAVIRGDSLKKKIQIKLNEIPWEVDPGSRVKDVRIQFKPNADICIKNGFPCQPHETLHEGDCVVLICRGEIPETDDLDALLSARHTPGVHEKMKTAVVGIAGLGGLGSSVVIALARMGIGTLIGADFDVVEPSNLNRQQYNIRHIGRAKTDAMKEIIAEINPLTRFEGKNIKLNQHNIAQVFSAAQVIVECLDAPESKIMLMEAVNDQLPDAYCIAASGVAGIGDSNRILTRKMGDRLFVVGDLHTSARQGMGLMAPRVGIAAHHQANLTVELLLEPRKGIDNLPEITD